MLTLIPHKDKEQLMPVSSGILIHPAQVMVKTTSGNKVLDLYVRDSTGCVYAKNGQYFIAILNSGLTSNSKITWVEIGGVVETYDKCHLMYVSPPEMN